MNYGYFQIRGANGRKYNISLLSPQPFEYAKSAFEKVKKIYKLAGVEENCAMVIGQEEHRFYAEQAWKVFAKHI